MLIGSEYIKIYENVGDFIMVLDNKERCERVYEIKEGDTLYKISRSNNISLDSLLKANNDVNVYNLKVGDKICIPITENIEWQDKEDVRRMFVYVVKEGDTLDGVLSKYDVDADDLLNVNNQNKIMLKPGSIMIIPGGN